MQRTFESIKRRRRGERATTRGGERVRKKWRGVGGGIWLGSVERPPSSMQSETQSAAISGKQRGKVAKVVTIFEAQKLK
jgi:hypothetical protein